VSVVLVDVVLVEVVDVVDARSCVGVVPVGTVSTGTVLGTSTSTDAPPHAPAASPATATSAIVSRRAVRGDGRRWGSR